MVSFMSKDFLWQISNWGTLVNVRIHVTFLIIFVGRKKVNSTGEHLLERGARYFLYFNLKMVISIFGSGKQSSCTQ